MAQLGTGHPLSRIVGRLRVNTRASNDIHRVEVKHEKLSKATERWLSLLREMEGNGEVTDARYDTYYQAYLQAKQQEKRVNLELFNLRQGLSER